MRVRGHQYRRFNDNSVLSERSANESTWRVSDCLPSSPGGSNPRATTRIPDVLLGQQAVLSSITWSRTGHHLVKQMGKHPSGSDGCAWRHAVWGAARPFLLGCQWPSNMFKPPSPSSRPECDGEDEPLHESTMPSSPPLYSRRRASAELEEEVNTLEEEEELQYPNDVTPSPSHEGAARRQIQAQRGRHPPFWIHHPIALAASLPSGLEQGTSSLPLDALTAATVETCPSDWMVYPERRCLPRGLYLTSRCTLLGLGLGVTSFGYWSSSSSSRVLTSPPARRWPADASTMEGWRAWSIRVVVRLPRRIQVGNSAKEV